MLLSNTKSLTLVLSLSAIILVGCGNDNKASSSQPNVPPSDEPSVLKIPDGVWIQKGFGRAIRATGESLNIYDYTRGTCLKTMDKTQDELAQTLTLESVNTDDFIATEDNGTLVFSKTEALPRACSQDNLITENGPVSTLEHVIQNFNDYYPFFEIRGITNWQERVEIARSQVNSQTTDDELLMMIINLLSNLNDGHVTLTAGSEFEFSPAGQDGKLIDILENGFDNQSETGDFGAYISAQLKSMIDIRDSYFDIDSLKKAGGESQDIFQWATIGNGVIGYIEVSSMGGISQNPDVNDADASEDLMDRILTDLAHTEALIINVMMNGGGDLAVADAIASRFATQSVRVFSYETISYDDSNAQQRTPLVHRELTPTERISYGRPVATISGPNTFSAAEHFLLSMRALNHPVCFIGERSDGILSAVLGKQLPMEDVSLGLSNMIIYDHTGQAFEAIGVPVDIESVTIELVESNSQSNSAIDTAMAALGFGYLVNRNIPADDCALQNARTRLEASAPR